MKSRIEANGDIFIDAKTIMDRFGVAAITVMRWSKRGLLPSPVKIGKHNYFLEKEVERRIASGLPR